jgi:hypothetical protein
VFAGAVPQLPPDVWSTLSFTYDLSAGECTVAVNGKAAPSPILIGRQENEGAVSYVAFRSLGSQSTLCVKSLSKSAARKTPNFMLKTGDDVVYAAAAGDGIDVALLLPSFRASAPATNDTLALQAAIDAAAAGQGGGVVLLRAGLRFTTWPLQLRSNVKLVIDGTLATSGDPYQYCHKARGVHREPRLRWIHCSRREHHSPKLHFQRDIKLHPHQDLAGGNPIATSSHWQPYTTSLLL